MLFMSQYPPVETNFLAVTPQSQKPKSQNHLPTITTQISRPTNFKPTTNTAVNYLITRFDVIFSSQLPKFYTYIIVGFTQ